MQFHLLRRTNAEPNFAAILERIAFVFRDELEDSETGEFSSWLPRAQRAELVDGIMKAIEKAYKPKRTSENILERVSYEDAVLLSVAGRLEVAIADADQRGKTLDDATDALQQALLECGFYFEVEHVRKCASAVAHGEGKASRAKELVQKIFGRVPAMGTSPSQLSYLEKHLGDSKPSTETQGWRPDQLLLLLRLVIEKAIEQGLDPRLQEIYRTLVPRPVLEPTRPWIADAATSVETPGRQHRPFLLLHAETEPLDG